LHMSNICFVKFCVMFLCCFMQEVLKSVPKFVFPYNTYEARYVSVHVWY